MPEPPPPPDPPRRASSKVEVSIKFQRPVYEQLRQAAADRGLAMAEIIRVAVAKELGPDRR